MTFAQGTNVSVLKSKTELEHLLSKHGATQRAFFDNDEKGEAQIVFSMGKDAARRQIKLVIPLPKREAFAQKRDRYKGLVARSQGEQFIAWEQACRERWRALVLIVKGKLEYIAMGQSSVEHEFLADLLLAEGQTVHEELRPLIAEAYERGVTPALMLGSGQ